MDIAIKMKNIIIKIGKPPNDKVVGRGSNMQTVLKYVSKFFKEGYTEIIVSGGKIGSWR